MNDLVRREGGQLPQGVPGRSNSPVSSQSVESVEWGGGPLPAFADLGVEKPKPAGRELHGVVADEGLVRRRRLASGDRYYRRRVGWVASTGGLAIIHAEQALVPDVRGRMRPSGDFVAEPTDFLTLAGPPKRRVGDVTEPTADPAQDGTGDRATTPQEKGFWRESPFAPAVVRQGLTSLVTDPTLRVALALSWDDGRRYSVSLLVMDRHQAVAVECSKLKGASSWQVEQLTYALDPGSDRVEGRPGRGHIGG